MKFKKLSALIIALAMTVCVFSACGDDAEKEKDGNKENNSVTNLEWTTNEINLKHAHLVKAGKILF